MRQCSIPVDALCERQRRELRSRSKTGGMKSKVEGRRNCLGEAEIQERGEATWSIPAADMSLPMTDSGGQRRHDQGGARDLGAEVLPGRRARTATFRTPEETGSSEGPTRKGKTPREAEVKEKTREVLGGKEREGGILEILPRIGRIPRGGAAEAFNLQMCEFKTPRGLLFYYPPSILYVSICLLDNVSRCLSFFQNHRIHQKHQFK